MGRSPCCEKVGLKKGPWTPEEDQKLLAYIEEHGHGSWRALPAKAGLQRCGKSCRLRWTNYLRPDIKRGKFSMQEEQTIIQLHALLGNRWSAIATHLPKRTDNEIKNYWNTHLKKRLSKMGIDPVTHKPKNDTILSSGDGQSKNAANLSHMAQWESARLEAEARLVKESKLRNIQHQHHHHQLNNYSPCPNSASPSQLVNKMIPWINGTGGGDHHHQLESPTSTLTFSEKALNAPRLLSIGQLGNGMSSSSSSSMAPMIEFVGGATVSGSSEAAAGVIKEEGHDQHDWKDIGDSNTDHHHLPEYKEAIENSLSHFTSGLHHEVTMSSMEGAAPWSSSSTHDQSLRLNVNSTSPHVFHVGNNNSMEEGFTNLLLNDSINIDRSLSTDSTKDSENSRGSGNGNGSGSDYYEDNKNYWNSILNLVNSSPSDSPMF